MEYWLLLLVIFFLAAGALVFAKFLSSKAQTPIQPTGPPIEPEASSDSSLGAETANSCENPKEVLARHGITIKVTCSSDEGYSQTAETVDLGELQSSPEGGWILNPKSTFPLTVFGCSRGTAHDLKQVLDQSCIRNPHELLPDVTHLVSLHNIRCKEVDAYVQAQRPAFRAKIDEFMKSSAEWHEASERDREDLLEEFKKRAIAELYIQPDADLEVLFEGHTRDITVDDKLIEKYGHEPILAYLRYAAKPEKVYLIPPDHYGRHVWEQLAANGLARRGTEIATDQILATLTIKEMAELVQDLSPPIFRRKAKAVEFLMSVSNIDERLQARSPIVSCFKSIVFLRNLRIWISVR